MTLSTPDTSTPAAILRARELTKTVTTRHSALTILSGVTLEVNRGETLAIVGASGSGKSTLLGLLAGLDHHSSGELWLAGHDLGNLDEDQRAALRRQYVGFVFQNFQLLPALTARENVVLPLELLQRPHATQEATRLLQAVGLEQRAEHYPRQLSGGEQQRVAIARAFACQPQILFADEPTGNLDRRTGESVIELLFDLNRQHATTLILVTHDTHLAQRCQRRLQLMDGRLEPLP